MGVFVCGQCPLRRAISFRACFCRGPRREARFVAPNRDRDTDHIEIELVRNQWGRGACAHQSTGHKPRRERTDAEIASEGAVSLPPFEV